MLALQEKIYRIFEEFLFILGKSLADCAEAGSGLFPDYRLAIRIQNIRKSLVLLKKCISRIKTA
jgi:hypothetical protein